MTLIRAHQGWPGWGLAEAWRYRLICLVLAKRDIKVRYRQTAVGATWAILQPALLMLAFTVFFGIMARLPTGGLPYAVFFFLGLLPLQLGTKMLSQGSTSVVANSALVSRVYFPRIYLPVAVALQSLVDFGFGCIALVVLLVIFQIAPTVNVLWAPIFVAVAFVAGLGVSIWLSALNVKYRDVTQLLPFLAQLWLFVSPVIYPSSIVAAEFRNLYYLNPMALAIDGMRWSIGNEQAPPGQEWLIGWSAAIAVLVSGYFFFRRREKTFADVV